MKKNKLNREDILALTIQKFVKMNLNVVADNVIVKYNIKRNTYLVKIFTNNSIGMWGG